MDGDPVSDYVTVFPEKGNEKFVAEALLSVADHPNQVQVDSRPRPDAGRSGIGFRVPTEVFERFQAMVNAPATEGEKSPETVTVADVEKSEPVKPKKAVGRPKKTEVTE